MTKERIMKRYGLSEAQFTGEEKREGSLDLRSLTSIPKGFNPTVGGSLYLSSLTSIPKGFNPTVGGSLDLSSLTSIPKGFNPTVGGSLDLRSLTSIPKGFNPTVGGSLYLSSLTSIPKGFNPTVGGSLDLRSLTSIPKGFNPTVGDSLYLSSLTSIPKGFNPTVGDSLYLSSLTSIPKGFNPTVGDSLDLRSLTSIPKGFNPTVGDSLYLRSLTSIPKGFNPTVGDSLYLRSDLKSKVTVNEPGLLQWQDGLYALFDDMLAEVISKKGAYWRCRKVGGTEEFFVATDGDKYAHGISLRQAQADLAFKVGSRDSSVYKSADVDAQMPMQDAVVCYRVITGACSFGVNQFLNGLEAVKESYSIKEIIALTKGAYGGSEFERFFKT